MAEIKKASVKSKVEAVLFSAGHRISLDDISRLCRSRKEDVVSALQELKREYDEKQSSLMLIGEGDFWKLTVRDHLIPIVKRIVTETELSRSVLETLAVIAFKYPILQSDLIGIRTNKAYEHLVELEKSGYISRQKHGRTNLIKLTEKFFKYFELTEENLKEKFRDFESIAKAIREKEAEVEKIKDEQRKKAEELKKEDERIKKEIELLDKQDEEFEVPLETYETKPKEIISEEFEQKNKLIVEKEKIGELEIVEEAQEKSDKEKLKIQEALQMEERKEEQNDISEAKMPEEQIDSEEKTKDIFEHQQEAKEQQPEQNKQKIKSEGIKLTPEMEAKVNQRVEEILRPEEEKN